MIHLDEDPDDNYSVITSPEDHGIDLTVVTSPAYEIISPSQGSPPLRGRSYICGNSLQPAVTPILPLLTKKIILTKSPFESGLSYSQINI